jgi:hypothetical protein
MESTQKPAPRSLPILFCQLIFAALIMFGMGAYVWLIQLQYDEAAKATVWTGRIWMPVFYALTVAAAGFSYDCAKSIIFLTEANFKKFLAYVRDAFISSIIVIVAMVAATYLLSVDLSGARFAGQIIYLVGLGFVWWAVQSVSGALTVAAGGDTVPREQASATKTG